MPDSTGSMREFQLQKWEKVKAHFNKWFSDLDFQALEIILSAAVAHTFMGPGEKPVWMFVVGPSGSGKTDVVVTAMQTAFPHITFASQITENTLLSGFQPRGRGTAGSKKKTPGVGYSMLERMGDKAILVFQDFTTFLGLNPLVQRAIASQLREIWDGETHKDVGSLDHQISWKGRLTIVALCTPELEESWGTFRSMGERFLIVRWLTGTRDVYETTAAASFKQDHEQEIKKATQDLVREFVAGAGNAPLPDTKATGLVYLARLVAWTRRNVKRSGRGNITNTTGEEMPTRINMALARVAQAHASLFHHKQIEDEDLQAARRLGVDTIPWLRRQVIELMPEPPDELTTADISKLAGEIPAIVTYTLEELEALKVVAGEKMEVGHYWRLTDEFAEVRRLAGLGGKAETKKDPYSTTKVP